MTEKTGEALTDISIAGSMPVKAAVKQQSNMQDYRQKMVSVPGFTPPAVLKENLCSLPEKCSQEEINAYRSAAVLLKALADEARGWSEKLPKNYRPAIMALLHGNMQMEVRSLAQVSFDGIRIEGMMGDSPCSVLAHQDTVQLMCYAVSTDEQEETEKHPIGFIWPDHDEHI